MASVVLAGAFGQGNPGDEALLEAFVHALPDRDVVATSSAPDHTITRHDCDAVSTRPADVRRAVVNADALVVAGGTVFKELHPRSGRRAPALLERAAVAVVGARAARKPVALVGVGAAPMSGQRSRALARLLVHAADLTVLRDEESALVLRELGAPSPFRVGADPAWTVVDPDLARREMGHDGRIVVVPSVFASASDAALVRHLTAALLPLASAGLPLALLPWSDGGGADERPVAEVVARRVGAEILPPPVDLRHARDLLRRSSLVVGFRFHALVAAAAAGARFLAVSHEPKLAALARRLGQPAISATSSADELATVIVDAAGYGAPPSPTAVRREVERAGEMLKLLRILLSDTDELDPAAFADVPLFPRAIAR